MEKKTEKRTPRTYKVKPSVYNKAVKRVKKDYPGETLASKVEKFVTAISNGCTVCYITGVTLHSK